MWTKQRRSVDALSLALLGTTGFLLLHTTAVFAQDLELPGAPGGPRTPSNTLCLILLGAILGVFGQVARSCVGLKKEMDDPANANKEWRQWFIVQELVVSLLIAAAAGAFAAIVMLDSPLDKKFLYGSIGAGYSGSDFIQGFMKTYLPQTSGKTGGT